MPKMVLTSEYFGLAGTDLSQWTRKAEVAIDVDAKEVTNFASLGWKEVLGGIKAGTIAVEFLEDFAVAALDSILWPFLGTLQTFEVRPTSAVVGTANPKWTGSLLVKELKPLSGGVGDEASMSVTWPTSGVVTRGTS